MPELPDVAAFQSYLEATSLHQPIRDVQVSDTYVLTDVTPQRLGERLCGAALEDTRRHGKHLFARADRRVWLRLHFGMTGHLKYFKGPGGRPRHERMLLSFRNGYHLAYVCQRKLGEVGLADAPERFVAQRGLGPDALAVEPEPFLERLRRRRGMAKTALMDQKMVAGIGNIYADEILFRCGLHPTARLDRLSEEQRREVFDAMKTVLRTAVDCGADADRMPDEFLLPSRAEGADCPRCGTSLVREKVGQRSAYFCPACQPAPRGRR